MSVRLTRKHSDAISPAAEESPVLKGRKAAASPAASAAGSRKKKPSAAARTPSPAGPPKTSPTAAAASSTPRGKARRNAQPDSSSTPPRPIRHLNDEPAEDEGQHATDEEDLLPSDSDNESVGSRAVRAPLRSRSRSNAKGGGSNLNVWHEAASSTNARAKPAPSVSWDPDASASPVGTWSETSQSYSYPAVEGSPFNESGPARKGSDARRAATAEKERTEAKRRERLYKEQKAAEAEAAAAKTAAAAAAAKGQRSCVGKLARIVLWTILACGLVIGFDVYSKLHPSGGVVGGSGRDAVSVLSSTLVSRFPRLQSQIERVLDPALRHHAESFVGLDHSTGSDSGSGSADAESSRSYLEGSLQSFQHPKPLVIVLATDGGSKGRGGGVDAPTFLQALHTALQSNVHAVQKDGGTEQPLALLQVGESDASLQMLREKLSAHFDATAPAASTNPLQRWIAPMLGAIRGAVPALGGFLGGSSSSSSSSAELLASSLSRGLVFVADAGRFPRSAAEAFHLWVDDVAAPVSRAAFLFEVDVSAVRQGAPQLRASDAVQRTLERQWEQGKVPRDEVIRPLLGRIVRNVVDLTDQAAK